MSVLACIPRQLGCGGQVGLFRGGSWMFCVRVCGAWPISSALVGAINAILTTEDSAAVAAEIANTNATLLP